MKLPGGIAPGAGITAGGRRLAVKSPQGRVGGVGGDGLGAGACAFSAASVIRNGRSEVEPQPARAAAAPEAMSS